MLSVRRTEIKPFADTSIVNRPMHKSGKLCHALEYWYECMAPFSTDVDAAVVAAPFAVLPPFRRCECGERAEILLQILLSNGIFKNIPYVRFAETESPLSVGINGVASPFNVDSV